MSAILLSNELVSLISEAKRKHNDLKNAAEKALQDLKALPSTSEAQLAADLSRRPALIEPFILACHSKNVKLAASGVTCLQRLVVTKALSKARLSEALGAFNACADLSLDVQLKVLQALPSLLQNYADDLTDGLLASALQICASLQSAKVQTVSGVATATLQQLVASVFEKVTVEDKHATSTPTVADIPGDSGRIALRPAAHDAYRLFRDLVLRAEDRQTSFVHLSSLSSDAALELIWSSINAIGRLFETHPELSSVIRSNLLPLVTRALSEKLSFSFTVRSLRILDLVFNRYLLRFSEECEVALGLMIQDIDSDSSPTWKRALVMECIRNVFNNGSIIVDAYIVYDHSPGGKPIVQDILSSFVRLSSEKPAAIGLAQQSSIPTGPMSYKEAGPTDQATIEAAGGMTGVISSAFSALEINIPGISPQWSLPRTAALDQLDKIDPPVPPETYIYALVLECLSCMSDTLARAVLPLTVRHENGAKEDQITDSIVVGRENVGAVRNGKRSQSFRKLAVPLNPIDGQESSGSRIHAVASLVDACWPAVLATSSTFLNAALEDSYYRNLIKAYQRFVQVAGLLRLRTPRDALMTTLSKSAVPPHILSAATAEPLKSPTVKSPVAESPRVFSNPKSLLSVDSFVSQALDRDRRPTSEPARVMLTTRNLLCLRALLNVAIALGPTLDTAFTVVFDALRQADMVLSLASPHQFARQTGSTSQKGAETPANAQSFSAEVTAVEAAASRLLESTADYPNDAFIKFVESFCRFLKGRPGEGISAPAGESPPSPLPQSPHVKRTLLGLPGVNMMVELQARDFQFVIPKLGSLAQMNIRRFVNNDEQDSGWSVLIDELSRVVSSADRPREARLAAADVLCKMSAGVIGEATTEDEVTRSAVQTRALSVLLQMLERIYFKEGSITHTAYEIQNHVLEALRSILEHSGESLVAGWTQVVAILASAFEKSKPRQQDEQTVGLNWENIGTSFVNVSVGRNVFSATQLICSDFLSALPTAVFPDMIELLCRFIEQMDDINVALTTVTMAWNVSDFLFGVISLEELDSLVSGAVDTEELEKSVLAAAKVSRGAQFMLLLLFLRDLAQRTGNNVRNAVFQTTCSVFQSHGEELTPATWDASLRSVFIAIAADDASRFIHDDEDPKGELTMAEDSQDMSKAIITGTANIIAQNIRIIEQSPNMASLWEAFLGSMEAYLDAENSDFNSAVYSALGKILSHVDASAAVWSSAGYRTVALWLKRVPEASRVGDMRSSNQESFVAYTGAAKELYRLTRDSMGTPQLRKMVENLYRCVRDSDGPRYGADSNIMSPLQELVLSLLKDIRTDLANIPSCLIGTAARFIALSHEAGQKEDRKQGPTFVALGDASLDWLSALLKAHIHDREVIESGALSSGLQNLRRLILTKYGSTIEHKGTSLWRKATDVTVEVAEALLSLPDLEVESRTSFWTEYVTIIGGIVRANGLEDSLEPQRIYDDQEKDIEAFRRLRRVLIPKLGDPVLPDSCRIEYCRSLFEASIVHPNELVHISSMDSFPLQGLTEIRRGSVKTVTYEARERMCFECFSELLALSAGSQSPQETRLAMVAAPLAVLRLALPLKAFIADQPLRGKRPQPLAEAEEINYCCEQIQRLEMNPDALGDDMGEKAHVPYLYPLLIRAMAVAGDGFSGSREVLRPLQAVLKAIAPPI